MGLKYIESKNYQGVRYAKLSDGDIGYYVRFTKNGKQIQKKVGTKFGGWSEKLAFNEKLKLENNHIEQKSVKFKEAMDRFLEVQKLHLKKKSLSTLKSQIKHLSPIENKLLENINQKTINDLIISLKQNLSNKTINEIISVLKNIINFAKLEYNIRLDNQDLGKVKNLKVENARERFLTTKEIVTLKKSIQDKPEHLLFINLALSTGARLEAILNITKKDISLDNETIILNDFKKSSTYQGYINNETKELLLKKWNKLKDNDKVVQKAKRLITEDLRELFNKLFNQNNPENKHRVVIHTLRHTFASHLAIKGVSIQIIQKLLNHKDIKMTMRYSHLMPDSGKEAVKNLWK